MLIHCSQVFASRVCGVQANKVVVRVKRLGGGFGGKETRSVVLSSAIALAAKKTGRPVRCMLTREEDMITMGQRHNRRRTRPRSRNRAASLDSVQSSVCPFDYAASSPVSQLSEPAVLAPLAHTRHNWLEEWHSSECTELFDADLEQANDQETVVNPLDVVDWWVFGHTHFTTKCQRGSVKLVSNQRGYVFPKQEGVTADLSSKASERDSPRKPSRFDKLMKALRLSPASRSLDVPTQHECSADTSLEDDWGHFDVRRTIEM